MSVDFKLGILDQSIVPEHTSVRQAVEETVATAQLAEQLGYSRFWVSEHHNSKFIAGSTPEVLIVKLADVTKSIRIGSGGIMLPNHSALKVAENFRMLETLFPGRIDLGMGRAPGGDRITSALLNPSNTFAEEDYIRQLEYLQHFLNDTAATKNGRILAIPLAETKPEQWILSSSGGSASIAGQFGMGLGIARFINGFITPKIIEEYHKNFRPSETFPKPQAILSIGVLCGETEEIAHALRKVVDYIHLQFEKGNFEHLANQDYIANYQFSAYELERIKYNNGRIISGTPQQVKEELTSLASEFGVNEIMTTSLSLNFALRRKSIQLLSQAFDLSNESVE